MLDQRGRNENARESLLSLSTFLVDFPPSFLRFRSADFSLTVINNNSRRGPPPTRRGDRSSVVAEGEISEQRKGKGRDGILPPDGNTSGRKGSRGGRRRGSGRIDGSDSQQASRPAPTRKTTGAAPVRSSRSPRSSAGLLHRTRRTFFRLFLFFLSYDLCRRVKETARFPACASAAELLDRARRERRSEVSLPETDPAC